MKLGEKIGLREESWRALVSTDGQREVMWGAEMLRGKVRRQWASKSG